MAHPVQNCLKFLISWGNFKCLPDPKELQTLAAPPSGCAFLCVSTHFLLDIFGPFIVLWSSVQTSFQKIPTQHCYSQQEEIINTQIWSSPGLIIATSSSPTVKSLSNRIHHSFCSCFLPEPMCYSQISSWIFHSAGAFALSLYPGGSVLCFRILAIFQGQLGSQRFLKGSHFHWCLLL